MTKGEVNMEKINILVKIRNDLSDIKRYCYDKSYNLDGKGNWVQYTEVEEIVNKILTTYQRKEIKK